MLIGSQRAPVTWQPPTSRTPFDASFASSRARRRVPFGVLTKAGPCGYALQQQLTMPRVTCQVIAPALIPRKPGERILNQSPRRSEAGGVAAGRVADRGASADAGTGSGPRSVPGP